MSCSILLIDGDVLKSGCSGGLALASLGARNLLGSLGLTVNQSIAKEMNLPDQ
jgi:hypothetical protein